MGGYGSGQHLRSRYYGYSLKIEVKMKKYTPAVAKKLYALQTANYQYRYIEKLEIKNSKPAIRGFCVGCSDGSYKDADNCKMSYCPFWVFRKGTPTQKELDVFVKELAKDEVRFSPLTLKLQNVVYVPQIRASRDILLK